MKLALFFLWNALVFIPYMDTCEDEWLNKRNALNSIQSMIPLVSNNSCTLCVVRSFRSFFPIRLCPLV